MEGAPAETLDDFREYLLKNHTDATLDRIQRSPIMIYRTVDALALGDWGEDRRVVLRYASRRRGSARAFALRLVTRVDALVKSYADRP